MSVQEDIVNINTNRFRKDKSITIAGLELFLKQKIFMVWIH